VPYPADTNKIRVATDPGNLENGWKKTGKWV